MRWIWQAKEQAWATPRGIHGIDMTVKRRLGAENSTTRAQLLDAVEAVMREDGNRALTARAVAERAGLKHQLVYYYFKTLEDLLVATYERHIERYNVQTIAALNSDRPLHAFWRVHSNPDDASLNTEFLSLANHNEAIRIRTIEFGEKVRRLGLGRLQDVIDRRGLHDSPLTPIGIAQAIMSIGGNLALETSIGITGGHAETRALMEWCLDQIEP